MPPIRRYSCKHCGFELPSGWGGYTYAVDDKGIRVVCPHPGEVSTISAVTGLDYAKASDAGRVGFAQFCVCLECLKQFDLDLKRDAVVCHACASTRVRSLRQLIGQPCPKCKTGQIEEGLLARWPLDPDWERLPVPQIVTDLVRFAEQRQVPASLERAAEIANGFGDHTFSVLTDRLLDWWQGHYSGNQDDSTKMRSGRTWCEALPKVLEATRALGKLIVINDGRCWFAKGVSPDLRRGIKNYVRKHRTTFDLWT